MLGNRIGLSLWCVLVLSCAAKVTGPEPTVNSLDPGLVCGEQLTTTVSIAGAELSPLAIKAATGDPMLAIPDVSVRMISSLDGTAADGAPIALPNDPGSPADRQGR